jgi:hypothetical protein
VKELHPEARVDEERRTAELRRPRQEKELIVDLSVAVS